MKTKRQSQTKKDNNLPQVIIRLNKKLADSGVCSRRKADELISSGVVKVNGKIVTELGTKVKPSDMITVNGDPIKSVKNFTYILLNKPKDYICTSRDEKGRKTVLDIVKTKARVYPVGRLDRNTTGTLLLTNDGMLTDKLLHPKNRVERVYIAVLDKHLKPEDGKKIANGLIIDEMQSSPCEVFIDLANNAKVTLILGEGKNHEVKRIFESLRYEVKKLDRKSFANLTTMGLNRGEYRHLTKKEVEKLYKMLNLEC